MTYDFTRTGPQIQAIHDTVSDPSTNQAFTDSIGKIVTPKYTDIVYKASGGNSAVDNMVSGAPIEASIGDICSTGGTLWERTSLSSPSLESDFTPLGGVFIGDYYSTSNGIPSKYSNYTPKNNESIKGSADFEFAVNAGQSAFAGNGTGDDFKYTEISNIRAQGQGEVSDDTKFISFDGQGNRVFNLFRGLRLSEFNTCIEHSAGWGNTSVGVDHRGSVNGVKYTTSPIQPGWAGSGNTSIGCAYQYNGTGIDESGVPWGNVYLNPILEGNDLGWLAEGNDTVMIGAWFEINTKDIQIERGFTTIGGGQKPTWTLPDVSIFNANEMINIINASQVTLTRGLPDGSDAVFHANGQGVKQIQSSQGSVNTESDRLRLGGSVFTQPGTTKGYGLSLHGAYFSSRLGDIYDDSSESKIIEMKMIAKQSLSGTGGAIGRIEYELGQYENTGLPFNQSTTPLVLEPNLVTTGGDAVADLGQPTNRFNNSYFAVAPTVGSSVHIKKDIDSIPQELCDFALSIENKMYKLINGTSGRDHFGIIIDDDFLEALSSVQDISKFGALCQSVFKDENGDRVSRHISGESAVVVGIVDHEQESIKYEIPSDTCELLLSGNLVTVVDGEIDRREEGVALEGGFIIDRSTYASKLGELESARNIELEKKNQSIERFKNKISSISEKLSSVDLSDEEKFELQGDLLLATKGLEMAEAINIPITDRGKIKASKVTFTFGGVKLGDFWQCRYDEWQNICLEGYRRLSNNQEKINKSLLERIERLEGKLS